MVIQFFKVAGKSKKEDKILEVLSYGSYLGIIRPTS